MRIGSEPGIIEGWIHALVRDRKANGSLRPYVSDGDPDTLTVPKRLAKYVDRPASSTTEVGSVLGTPAYAPPEQLALFLAIGSGDKRLHAQSPPRHSLAAQRAGRARRVCVRGRHIARRVLIRVAARKAKLPNEVLTHRRAPSLRCLLFQARRRA